MARRYDKRTAAFGPAIICVLTPQTQVVVAAAVTRSLRRATSWPIQLA
jgi:hypothetical protein